MWENCFRSSVRWQINDFITEDISHARQKREKMYARILPRHTAMRKMKSKKKSRVWEEAVAVLGRVSTLIKILSVLYTGDTIQGE